MVRRLRTLSMMLPAFSLLLVIHGANSQSDDDTPFTEACPVVLPTNSRIVGGRLMESPYMVFILIGSGSCSGALITQTHIATARHCEVTPNDRVFVSSANGLEDGEEIPIARFANHPTDDIMMVELVRPANVQPLKVLTSTNYPTAWSFVRAQGYGVQSSLPVASDTLLRFVDMPVIPTDVCEEISRDGRNEDGTTLADDPAFPSRYVCSGYLQSGSCTFCSGDSGGPVIGFSGDDPVLVGVISFGDAFCSRPNTAGFSVRIASHIGWLDELGIQYDGVAELSETFVEGDGNELQGGLSTGAIAGIVVGVVVAAAAVLAALFVFKVRKNRDESGPPADGGDGGQHTLATGSYLMPPDQSGVAPAARDLPSPAISGGFTGGHAAPPPASWPQPGGEPVQAASQLPPQPIASQPSQAHPQPNGGNTPTQRIAQPAPQGYAPLVQPVAQSPSQVNAPPVQPTTGPAAQYSVSPADPLHQPLSQQ